MINRLLEEGIQTVVGDEAFVKLKHTEGYRNALKEFDVAIKVSFAGKNDPDKYISFPMANLEDRPAKGLFKNSMTLSGQVQIVWQTGAGRLITLTELRCSRSLILSCVKLTD